MRDGLTSLTCGRRVLRHGRTVSRLINSEFCACTGEVHVERQDDVVRPAVSQLAQVRGRGEEHRGQGSQGNEHGEGSQRTQHHVDGDGVRTHQTPANWYHVAADK